MSKCEFVELRLMMMEANFNAPSERGRERGHLVDIERSVYVVSANTPHRFKLI